MDAARQARRRAAKQREEEHRFEAAQLAHDFARDVVESDLTGVPDLRRAVDRLARQCGGILPDGVRSAWRTVDDELLVAGDTGIVDRELVEAVNGFTLALAAEFDTQHTEEVHDPDREYTGSRIPAGDYFAGGDDGSGDGLVDVAEGEEAGDEPAEEAGGTEGD